MTLNKLGGIAGSILAITAVIGGTISFFETRAHAAETVQKLQAEQKASDEKTQRSLRELQVQGLLNRVKQLNAKGKLSADERLELDLNVKQIAALQGAK